MNARNSRRTCQLSAPIYVMTIVISTIAAKEMLQRVVNLTQLNIVMGMGGRMSTHSTAASQVATHVHGRASHAVV